jgi:hypothetical protein
MDEGDELLKRYVKRCINGTAFDIEPIEELQDKEEVGFGTNAFRVYATNLAINTLGEGGEPELERLGDRLRTAAEHSQKRVFAVIDTDSSSKLRFAKLTAT